MGCDPLPPFLSEVLLSNQSHWIINLFLTPAADFRPVILKLLLLISKRIFSVM